MRYGQNPAEKVSKGEGAIGPMRAQLTFQYCARES